MKRYIYAIFCLIVLASCQREPLPEVRREAGRMGEGRATLHFSVNNGDQRDATRASFSSAAQINSLKLAIFDEEGFLTEVVDATLTDPTGGADRGYYSATLALSYEHRIIHVLANYSDDINFGTEEESIATLYTEDKYDAYWQRIDLPDGITVQTDPSTGEPLEDSDGNWIFDDSVSSAMEEIPLIRNFARFTITESASNIDILRACIVGGGDKGAVAPYNRPTSQFIADYKDYATPAELIASSYKYNGCVPELANPTEYADAEWADFGLDTYDNKEKCIVYSYEREMPHSNPAYILIEAKYGTTQAARNSSDPVYYKINLRDEDNNYFPILRNFDYKININSVTKEGYPTVQEAIDGPGSGDISTDLGYLELTNISNGEARIFVSYTDRVLVTGSPVEFKFKFIPNMAEPTVTSNGDVTITRGEAGYYGPIFDSDSKIDITSTVDEQGYTVVYLTPVSPDEFNKTQTLTVTGHYTKDDVPSTITRVISFTLREKPSITISCANTVAKTAGTGVTLNISIPGGLSESMFPLNLLIEAEEGTLTPNASVSNPEDKNLPVRYGKSMFDESKPGYYYIRQITWDEYEEAVNNDGIKTFKAEFKTNAAVSATAILARNDYFFDGMTYFKNTGDANSFKALKFESPIEIGVGQTTDFSFIATSADPVTVTLTNATWNNGTSDVTTFTITPTPFVPQTISGIKAGSFGNAVTVSLSATGYTSESKLTNRSVTIPANSVSGSYNPYGTDFGGDSEEVKTSSGILYVGRNTANAFADVPVNVTRTGTSETISAPKFSGTPTATRGGYTAYNRTYQFNFTISNFDSSIEYYWSTTNSSSAIPEGNRIASADAGIPAQSSRDVYIWAKKDGQFSNSSYLSAANVGGTNNVTNNNPGTDKTIISYTYSFTGPTQATTVELDSDVQSTDKIYIYYDSSNYVELNLSDL